MQSDSIPTVATCDKVIAPLLLLLFSIQGNCQTGSTSGRPDLARFHAVDLQAHANQKRLNDFPTLKNLPGNNLAALAAGKHEFLGRSFQVGDGILHLGSTLLVDLPKKIEIKIGKKFNTLQVLHSAAYAVDEGQVTIATYTLRYDDGKSHTIAVVNEKDVASFWKRPGAPEPTTAKEAWVGSNDFVKKNGSGIRLFVSTWENPRPKNTVLTIEFVSAMTKAAPFCVAMTVAEPLQPRPAAKQLTAADLDRHWTALADNGAPCCDAIEILAGAPAQALPFLAPRVRPIQPTADAKEVAALIARLEAASFTVREKATAELEKLGLEAIPQLLRAKKESKSPEVQLRSRELLEKLSRIKLTPDHRRLQAVVHVLELMATDQSRKVLDEAASGKAGAWLAAEAALALKRMENTRPAKD